MALPRREVCFGQHMRDGEAYGDSMTVVRNGGLIPLPNRRCSRETLPHAASLAEEGGTTSSALADQGQK